MKNKRGAHGKAWNHNTGCVAHGWCVPGMSTGACKMKNKRGTHEKAWYHNQRASEASELSYVRVQSRFEIYALDVRQPLCACPENHC